MKNKGIVIFLFVLALVIVGVIAIDFNSTKPDQQPANPYEYNIDTFTRVDTALIMYKESRNLKINLEEPAGISLRENRLFVVGDQKLQIIEPTGRLIQEVNLDQKPTCLYVSDKNIFIGYRQSISLLNHEGVKLADWNSFADSTVITSIAEQLGIVFVADAGKRLVRKFNLEGKPMGEIEGKSGNDQIHGFIIPSPYFDLAFNLSGELWVVNPGKHTLENYTVDGKLRTWWEATSIKIEGFSGCCNPAHFAFLPDGGFVTSEKGLVRIKTYLPSGEFANVVAAPSKFKEEGHAPDLAVDDQGNIYALDFDKKMIRLFVKK